MTDRLYLDHAATTPVLAEARRAVAAALEGWSNPNSPHSEGRSASAALELAREICLGAPVAVQESIALARLTDDMAASDMWPLGERTLRRGQSTEDFMIGMKAFSAKQVPQWRGR